MLHVLPYFTITNVRLSQKDQPAHCDGAHRQVTLDIVRSVHA